MAKFKKRPIVVEAVQFWPDKLPWPEGVDHYADVGYAVDALEGRYRCSPGDWIITDVNGDRRPCRPPVFEATYEPVVELSESVGS